MNHRETYPEQYSHELCGKTVTVEGRTFTIERVVPSMFGMLVKVPDSDMAYSVDVVERALTNPTAPCGHFKGCECWKTY